MAEIGRLLTAMVTPFDEEGKVGYEQAQRLALALLDSGSDGVVLAGTTGEAPTLSHEEKIRLFGLVKQAVGDRGAVIAGTGTYNTAESVELSREAEFVAQVDGLLLTCPYYNRPPQGDLYAHFSRIASSVPIPCILYNIPSRTGVNMTAETTLKLLEDIPNIVGIKEASGDLGQIGRVIAGAPEGKYVWSGDDQLTLPILSIGGHGVICVVSHLFGKSMKQMIQAYLEGDVVTARDTHLRLLPFMSTLMTAASNPIPIKYALNEMRVRVGGLRLPLSEAEGEVAGKIQQELLKALPVDIAYPIPA